MRWRSTLRAVAAFALSALAAAHAHAEMSTEELAKLAQNPVVGHKPILEPLAVANSGMSVAAYSARVTPAS